MDKRRFRIWHIPLFAFFSKQLYRDIAVHWKGTNLGVLCVLLAVCLLPSTRQASRSAGELIDRHAAAFLMQIPEIHIVGGCAHVDAPQPYSIIDGDRTVLLIDTTGKINSLADADADALLTATHLYVEQTHQSPWEFELATINNYYIDQAVATDLVERFKHLILPVFYIISLITIYITLVLAALLCGLIAKVFGKFQNKDISYATGLRLAATAFTPPLVTSALLALFEQTIPPILYILLALAYLIMGVSCFQERGSSEQSMDREPI